MKIAFLVGGNYSTSLYIVTRDVVNCLRSKGYMVDYIFVEEPIELKDNDIFIDINGVSKKSFNELRGLFFRICKNILDRHVYAYLFSSYFSSQLQKKLNGYDKIFIHGTASISFGKLKTPYYCVLHSCKFDNFIGKHRKLVRPYYKKFYQKVYSGKNLLSVSDSVKLDMINKMEAKPISIDTIYNGFNFEHIETQAALDVGVIHSRPYIIAAGRPDRTKRFDILLKAYAMSMSKCSHDLIIFGDGKRLNKLKELAKELSIEENVIFKGFNKNILPYIKNASAYVLSSDVEGLPTVVVESLVVGTPVVATDVGGIRELLNGELSDWIVPRGDYVQLAEKLDLLLENPPKVSSENISFLDFRIVCDKYIGKI
ncbi:MAG: glycosyltransferase [Vibrio sp.]|uniref:glycosyltransferase n=1 Tax=Vibrio sp. TaxID=678 RepID=UPI003A85F9E3